jgi:nucleoside-diphosphate-sugar epimerase
MKKIYNKLIDLLLQDNEHTFDNIDTSQLNNKKILITGASGLLGVHFLSSLLYLKNKLNYNILVIAIFNSEPETWFKELIDLGNFSYMRGDLSDITFVDRLLDVDYIIHCATYAQPMKFTQDAIKTITLNTTTTNALIKKLKPNGKFLFVSSSEIYSGLDKNEYVEDDIGTTTPSHVRSCYIEGKRCGEAICHSYIKQGVDIKIARLCLGYGTGIKFNDTRAMNSFIINALKHHEIRLLDSGNAKRNYIYASDVVKMMWNIFLQGKSVTYNIGGDNETDIKTIASYISQELFVPLIIPEDDNGLLGSPVGVRLDIDKYNNEFGNFDKVALGDGIKRTIKWCKLISEF